MFLSRSFEQLALFVAASSDHGCPHAVRLCCCSATVFSLEKNALKHSILKDVTERTSNHCLVLIARGKSERQLTVP